MSLAILNNEILEAGYKSHHILPIVLELYAKVEHDNKWRTYRERIAQLENKFGHGLSMIRGQCMQVLLDNMKHDPDWYTTSESYNPLTLLKLIEKTILAQTEDQYCYVRVYNQVCSLYCLHQHNLTNEHYYEIFNTKVDVGEAIVITRQHHVLMEYMAQETFFKSLMTSIQIKNWN